MKPDYYLSSLAVFALDVVASVAASLTVLAACNVINPLAGDVHSLVSVWLTTAAIASIGTFYLTKFYRSVIRYSTLRDAGLMCGAVAIKELVMALALVIFSVNIGWGAGATMLILDFMATFTALMMVRVAMAAIYRLTHPRKENDKRKTRVLIYGTDEKAASLPTRLNNSNHFEVAGFLTADKSLKDVKMAGKPVYTYSEVSELIDLADEADAKGILFAHYEDARDRQKEIIEMVKDRGLKMFVAPSIDDITDGLPMGGIRKIRIEDLLGRDEIRISMKEIREMMEGKTVMVTGAAGSIGSELCRQLSMLGVGKLIMFDNAETPLHNVRLEFEDRWPELDFTPVIGDVRQKERLDFVFRKYHPQIVFHAAAYKHVPLMEENPCEAVRVNVVGSRNVADKCVEYDVERMVMISTDKAVNPTNIMGCTKRLAEIYVQSLGLAIERGEVKGKTTFVTTRFGNVLGSNGSVIPRFEEQIRNGGPLTVTHPEIRRFFMTIPEACRLVMEAATMATGTQIFVFDMGEAVKIADLAKSMIQLAGFRPNVDINIEYTGLRPGEKLYEEVLATKENTLPTEHERIHIAKVRSYAHNEAKQTVSELDSMSMDVEIDNMVRLMKRTVPEFKSKNSVFEKFDNEEKN